MQLGREHRLHNGGPQPAEQGSLPRLGRAVSQTTLPPDGDHGAGPCAPAVPRPPRIGWRELWTIPTARDAAEGRGAFRHRTTAPAAGQVGLDPGAPGHLEEGVREALAPAPNRAGADAGVDRARGPVRRGHLRGTRHGREGWHDQAHHGAPQRSPLSRGRPRHPDRTRAGTVVLPALRLPPALRGEIVLFDRSWYNRAGIERVMEFCTEEEHADFFRTCPQLERALGAVRDRPGQVLVVPERRGAGTSLQRADAQPRQAMEVERDGPGGSSPVGGLRRGQGRDVRLHGHQGGPVVRRRRGRQAGSPAQHHQSSLGGGALPGRAAPVCAAPTAAGTVVRRDRRSTAKPGFRDGSSFDRSRRTRRRCRRPAWPSAAASVPPDYENSR